MPIPALNRRLEALAAALPVPGDPRRMLEERWLHSLPVSDLEALDAWLEGRDAGTPPAALPPGVAARAAALLLAWEAVLEGASWRH